jgi:hypothetical protein
VLDPFTTACMIALVNFVEEGSKLVIEDNYISFTKPSAVSVGVRSVCNLLWEGYSREALAHLRKPIARALLWYNKDAPTVFKNASLGMRKLISTYKGNTNLATETLTLCLLTLEKHTEIPELLLLPGDVVRQAHLEKLQHMWSDSEVRCVEGWFAQLQSEQGPREQHIRTIRDFLNLKQPRLRGLMRDTAV